MRRSAQWVVALAAALLVLGYGFEEAWSSAKAALGSARLVPADARYGGLAGRYRAGARIGYFFLGRSKDWMSRWIGAQFESAPGELELCRGRAGLVEDLFAGKEILVESDHPAEIDELVRELGLLGASVGLRPEVLHFDATLASIVARRVERR